MKPNLSYLFSCLLALAFLGGCTASEKAARLERREQFRAQQQARKNGEIIKHKVGEDPKLAAHHRNLEKKEQKKKARDKKKKNRGWFSMSRPARTNRSDTSAPRNYSSKDVATVIQAARSYIGTPYRDAGTTRIGMDCSGLMVTSFQSIDLKLPRNSRDQSNFGTSVNLKQLREGDLVFFGPSRNSTQITHVGLVTEVKGSQDITFIHSSTSLGVIENNLFSKYYIERFVKAARPF